MALLLAVPVYAEAHRHPTICDRAYSARSYIVHTYGYQAAGRNVCRPGVHGRRSSTHARAVYLRALRDLAQRAPAYLTIRPGLPHRWPGGTLTVHYRAVGLAACIVYVESRGNPRASNGSHTGVGQWTGEAWARMRGLRFAPSPLGATLDEQLLTLSYGLEHWGCRDWCPFDPC